MGRVVALLTRGLLAGLVIAAGVVFLPEIAAAPPEQTGTPIRYGETVSGEITESTPCLVYWFNGTEGDPITIDMVRTSGTLDGVLSLYRRDGSNFTAQPVASNDDGPAGVLDPQIITRLPVTDWYSITACRLQHEQMRVTTGTFDLTLAGPDVLPSAPVIGPTAPPLTSLTDGLFAGASGEGTTPAVPAPAATPTGIFSGWGSSDQATAAPVSATLLTPVMGGSIFVEGSLAEWQSAAEYQFSVPAGNEVHIICESAAEMFAPLLRVESPDGSLVALASTSDPVAALALGFRAPSDAPLTLLVAHADSYTAVTFRLEILVLAATEGGTAPQGVGSPTVTPVPTVEAGTPSSADYLANPCQSGASAVMDLTSSDRLIDVYTAAGDSYYADQLTRTTTFRQDDDLNAVFLVQNVSGSINVGGVFCPPSGDYHDGGESDFGNGGPYLVGLDWEAEAVNWEIGRWFVELYVDGTLELTLGFDVQ